MSGLAQRSDSEHRGEDTDPTLSEKCMFFRGFIRIPLNVPKIKDFGHTQKSFDVKQKYTLDIS